MSVPLRSLWHCLRAKPRSGVRVLQITEAGQSPRQIGVLRICGRMAEVCAELDRLAACEAA
jgi:hypothetical protein